MKRHCSCGLEGGKSESFSPYFHQPKEALKRSLLPILAGRRRFFAKFHAILFARARPGCGLLGRVAV